MFARSVSARTRRRGIVLVLILGMLGLLALIGVTFATFSNQSQINARNFSQSANFPDSAEMFDFALAQLIGDTANSQSVLRGHSLKRDMYGNDATNNGALLYGMPDGSSMTVTSATIQTSGTYAGMALLTTNIPSTNQSAGAAFYGYDFTRWVLTFPSAQDSNNGATYVARTHEVLVDLPAGDGNYRQFYVAVPSYDLFQATATPLGSLKYVPPYDSTASSSSGLAPMISGYLSGETSSPTTVWKSTLWTVPLNQPFLLDGRFLRAFNGPGIAGMNAMGNDGAWLPSPSAAFAPHPLAEYANFRYSGNIFSNVANLTNPSYTASFDPAYCDPNIIPVAMDEDYDACDLENWFLAIQSADGKVVVPSFHRPGIVTALDWSRTSSSKNSNEQQVMATRSMSRILRPRQVDGHSPISFPDLIPKADGTIQYDVDNDGDGTTDSVWLDLGYPAKRSPEGQLFKPLFAFMVIGLNGRLPLNTAGNLQARDNSLQPTFDHAEHLGTSPSEIDLRYALQNAWDPNYVLGNAPPYQQTDNAGLTAAYDAPVFVSQTQSRNILAGTRPWTQKGGNGDQNVVLVNNQFVHLPNNMADIMDTTDPSGSNTPPTGPGQYVYRTNPPVAGRWGEEDYVPGVAFNPLVTGPAPATTPPNFSMVYNNAIRAGYSAVPPGGASYDARDDNFNTFDFNGEGMDYYDATGSLALPVERYRRFVTPVDLDGNGRVITFNQYQLGKPPTQDGADAWGRVSFFRYFRPPGLPFGTAASTAAPAPNVPAPLSVATPYVKWYDGTAGAAYHYDVRTNNPFHGFMSALTPDFTGTNAPYALSFAGMPTDIYLTQPAPPSPPISIGTIITADPSAITSPTYSISVNSNTQYVSPGVNEADEMDLYTANRLDAPFGPGDLEWLYRYHDVDGASLNSRLQDLAPISFLNPRDGGRRRRLFSLDTWEPTSFVWANDNPQGAFNRNSRFNALASASFVNNFNQTKPITPDPAADFSALANPNIAPTYNAANVNPMQAPSLAHRDRRINLNFPLPVSNSPYEPIRQKWVRETYQMLKAVLPPRAIDTPEELAQLSQYVVNIVDFRDPDCTMTKFVNTDVLVTEPATSNGNQAVMAFSTGTPPGLAFDPLISPAPGTTAPHYLVQYGMEYQPVAINEVLAYMFQTKNVEVGSNAGDPSNDTPRMLFELVNMLTKDGITETSTYPNDSSNLDLTGWDFTVLPDDSQGRPDPFTGQIPLVQTGLWMPSPSPYASTTKQQFISIPVSGGSLNDFKTGGKLPLATPAAADPPLAALTPRSGAGGGGSPDNPNGDKPAPPTTQVYYYVFGPPPPVAGTPPAELPAAPAPSTNNKSASATAPSGYVDLTGMLYQRKSPVPPAANPPATSELNPGYYYWLYLRRPANPFDPTSEMVVVDSFRFVFTKSKGIGWTETKPGPPSTKVDHAYDKSTSTDLVPANDYIFSLERLQPYRGGHAVPPITPQSAAGAPLSPMTTPGPYSTFMTAYGFSEQTAACQSGSGGGATYVQGKYGSASTTGPIYHTLGKKNSPFDNSRDYLPFNDRDFMSVVELMMVPGCAPGLFTKQFAELAPPIPAAYQCVMALPYMVPQPFGTTNPPPTTPPLTTDKSTWTNSPWPSGATSIPIPLAGNGAPHSFPYLNDEFFYTGANEPVPPTVSGTNGWVANEPVPSATTFVPYRSPSNKHYIGGPGGAGAHKMLDFFEVPSQAIKAIGEVSSGVNYDWARQDLRPGLINLNLVVDEEVFLGVMGPSVYRYLNQGQVGMPNSKCYSGALTPSVVTQANENGSVGGSYHIPNVGHWDLNGYKDPVSGLDYNPGTTTYNALMKACFADFLSLRHGGSGYLFGNGTGGVGSLAPLASERPFHSLSYPDINYTVLRPAALPPSAYTLPTATTVTYPMPSPAPAPFVWDPGVKSPYLFVQTVPVQPPPIPPRRLFQFADAYGSPDGSTVITGGAPANQPSNASIPGDPNVTTQAQLKAGLTILNSTSTVTSAYPDLTAVPYKDPTKGYSLKSYLGGQKYDHSKPNGGGWVDGWPIAVGGTTPDQSDHPYFRTEWLQKVTNLTTVRTHQYAVWITVGFFEVTAQGDPALAATSPFLAYDTLGNEIGLLDGQNVRYRGFFLVDRTRAVGFNPYQPDDFRACVAYRQLIE